MTRRRLVAVVVALAAAWPFVIDRAGLHRLGLQVMVLALVGLSLVVTVGWLRTVSLYQPVAVAAGSALTTGAIGGGQAPPAALVLAAVAGAAVALVVYLPVARIPRLGFPVASLALTAVVAEYVLPRLALSPFSRPVLLGVDLSGDRTVYLVGLVLAVAGGVVVHTLHGSDLGRLLQAVGVDPDVVSRSGHRPAALWRTAVVVSGVLAGSAGWLDALLQEGFAGPHAFGPDVAVAVLAIPLLGGARWASGAFAGAIVYLVGVRLATVVELSPLVLACAAVVAVTALGGRGIVGWAHAAGRPAWERAVRGPLA